MCPEIQTYFKNFYTFRHKLCFAKCAEETWEEGYAPDSKRVSDKVGRWPESERERRLQGARSRHIRRYVDAAQRSRRRFTAARSQAEPFQTPSKCPAAEQMADPVAGLGTLPIEAAMLAANMAPGLRHHRFAFVDWVDFDSDLWSRLYNGVDQVIKSPNLNIGVHETQEKW